VVCCAPHIVQCTSTGRIELLASDGSRHQKLLDTFMCQLARTFLMLHVAQLLTCRSASGSRRSLAAAIAAGSYQLLRKTRFVPLVGKYTLVGLHLGIDVTSVPAPCTHISWATAPMLMSKAALAAFRSPLLYQHGAGLESDVTKHCTCTSAVIIISEWHDDQSGFDSTPFCE
jgi:hypothetical protein